MSIEPTPTPTAPVSPVLQAPPTGAPGGPPIPPPPPTVAVSIEEFQRLRSLELQFNDLKAAQQAAVDAADAQRIKALADKGEVEEALKETRKTGEPKPPAEVARYTQLETQVFTEKKNATLNEAL